MKIGILTVSRTNNIGTDMQALAMQWLFGSFGKNQVELINYKCKKQENSRKILAKWNLHGILSVPYNFSRKLHHEQFRKRHFCYSKDVYDTTSVSNIEYDLVVTGSDQIWNLNITGNDLSFFIPFHFNGIKASYAASVSEKNIQLLINKYDLFHLLNDFSVVSVREKKSAALLSSNGIPARFDLDPLLMIETTKWDLIASKNKPNRGYVFLYVVDKTNEAIEFAKNYAKEHHLDVYMWGNIIKPIKGVKAVRFKGPRDWISFIKHADFIVTNSYHGLSFVINYQKKFAIFNLNNTDSNERLNNLLEIAGLENFGDGHIYNPNWSAVNANLEILKQNAISYITQTLEKTQIYVENNQIKN